MNWQTLALINAVFIALGMILQRLIGRNRHYAGASFVINAGAFVFLWLSGLAVLPQLGHVDNTVLSEYLWRFIGGGAAFALTNVATYKSLTYIDAAVGTIFNTLNALFTIGMAALILHEDLSWMQAAGGVILVSAVIYCALAMRAGSSKISRQALLHGLGFALLAALIYSVAIVNEKSLLAHMSSASYVVYGWGWQMLASVIVAVVLQPRKLKLLSESKLLRLVIPLGIFKGLGGAAFVLAEVRSNNVALIQVVTNFKIIIVVVLGAWLLRERQKLWQKATGAITALIGLSVMFWK